ncbi:receptor-like protein 12 [Gossypium australe]|uniref:Receptor-like protein 12 n=1 Tax=Gossypium australe TaxID=47621 RepID=A0A5B6V0H9_9ROSI|nr:receptor-like protein 12 [Gossypium australe]
MALWQILLSEFDIVYVNQKTVKESAIADFLASRALEDYEPLNFDLPNEDLMYVVTTKEGAQEEHPSKLNFSGASNAMGNEIGAVLVSPNGDHYPFTSKLDFDCMNNMTEYEACIMGICAAIEHKIKVLVGYGYSVLVIYQLKGEWETRDPKLIEYRRLVLELIKKFDDITFCYLSRDENQMGMDVIGPISLKTSNEHRFIFMVIDYFTKWVEIASYANVTKSVVSKFLKKEIICRYGMPERTISDNALNLNNNTIMEVCSQFKIKHHKSSPYRPKMNSAVEAANKNIKKIVGKMTETYKDWHEKLPFALYVYRTSVRTSTGAMLFSLVYGMEAALPIEVEIPSL